MAKQEIKFIIKITSAHEHLISFKYFNCICNYGLEQTKTSNIKIAVTFLIVPTDLQAFWFPV